MDESVMTTDQVREFLGYQTMRGTTKWLRQRDIKAVSRHPGPHGQNIYPRVEVVAAKATMLGRGYRTDLKTQPRAL
jgi:hypothetical protein